MWGKPTKFPYQSGKLFLGKSGGKPVGIATERHAITIAGAGAGKGASVIIPNLMRWPHNALVIDPKGEAAERTADMRESMGQRVHVIDPFDSARVDRSLKATYNPLADLDIKSRTIKEDIETISDGIIMRGDASAQHWDDGAQAVLSGLIAYVLLTEEPIRQTLPEVRSILRNAERFDTVMDAMKNLEGCGGLAESGASAAMAKEGSYFVSNAEKNTRWLDSEAMRDVLSSSSFSLSDLKRRACSVYLVLPANYLGQHGRFLRLFVRCGIEAMAQKMDDGELRGRQCLFMLDEFYSLGYIDEISKAAGLMRGYGLQLWPILQDLGQLVSLYGREGAETFFGNADLHQFFGNTDPMTLDHISQRLGVVGVDEIRSAPSAPMQVNLGIGNAIAGGMGTSSKGGMRATGAVLGGVMGGIGQSVANAQNAAHQNDMQDYQRQAMKVGKPRMAADEVGHILAKREGQDVAPMILNFVSGQRPLLIGAAPYFRNPPENDAPSRQKNMATGHAIKWISWRVATLAVVALVIIDFVYFHIAIRSALPFKPSIINAWNVALMDFLDPTNMLSRWPIWFWYLIDMLVLAGLCWAAWLAYFGRILWRSALIAILGTWAAMAVLVGLQIGIYYGTANQFWQSVFVW